MITHDMLTDAIFHADYFEPCFRCQNRKPNCDICSDKMITEYEESIRADTMRVFKEWFKASNHYLCYSESIDDVIAEFEKEKKNE